jgi:hypothetical protein
MKDWREYSEIKPPEAGVYEWSVPSRTCEGMRVIVLAHHRKRGAGHRSVLSPVFDYWDGYRVHVPKGTLWRETTEGADIKWYQQRLIGIDGLDFAPCPFCGEIPRLKGNITSGNGVILSDDPHRINSWWLECCAWAKTPHYSDPRELEKARHAKIEQFQRNAA